MGKRKTPPPDRNPKSGCASTFVVLGFVGIALAVGYKRYWPLVLAVPMAIWIYWIVSQKLLLSTIAKSLKNDGFLGLLVTSDSSHWKEYIEEKWLSCNQNTFKILNWSQHTQWESTIYTRAFHRFCGFSENFCPSVILFRGLRYPLVFRFFYAFRSARHGDEAALKTLEERMFKEIIKLKGA
jgi:hypothetical protein